MTRSSVCTSTGSGSPGTGRSQPERTGGGRCCEAGSSLDAAAAAKPRIGSPPRLMISIQVPGPVRVAPVERKITELTTTSTALSARSAVKRRAKGDGQHGYGAHHPSPSRSAARLTFSAALGMTLICVSLTAITVRQLARYLDRQPRPSRVKALYVPLLHAS